jgi:hypothetical protein
MALEAQNPYESAVSVDELRRHSTRETASNGANPGAQLSRVTVLVTMILAAAATRILPHPWNFTAVGALCLFGGTYFHRRWAAVLVPIAALALSDVYLATFLYGFGSLRHVWVSYVLFVLTVCLGMGLRGRVTFGRITVMAIVASGMFFLVSNFHAWVVGHGGYPLTPAGLLACYVAAIPFAQNMLLANLFYSGVLFGGYELLSLKWPALQQPAFARVA